MKSDINTLGDAENFEVLSTLAKLARARQAPEMEWLDYSVRFRMNADGSVTATDMQMTTGGMNFEDRLAAACIECGVSDSVYEELCIAYSRF